MKNSVLKGALGALAVAGVALIVKKAAQRKRFVKGIFEEYGIKEKSPFGLADKIREMNDEQYQELKGKFKKEDFNELQNGLLLLKGGDVDEEMEEREVSYVSYHLDDYFQEDFFETKKVVYVPWEGKR